MGNVIRKQNVFYILIFLILISYISIYLFQSNLIKNINCEEYLVSYEENLTLDQYLEKNPLSIRNNIALIELNIFPDLKSVQCLGKSLDYKPTTFKLDKVVATSHKLLEVVNFLNVTVIYLLFLLFSKQSKFLFILISFISFFISTNLFFGSIIFNYYFLIYPLAIIVFNFSKFENNSRSKILDLFVFVNVVFLIFYYNFYTLILPFVIIFYFFVINKNLDSHHFKILNFGAIFYYFLRQLSGAFEELTYIWQKLSSSMFRGTPRFADMYYTFAVLDCNKTGCGFKNNYGPLWEYLAIDLNIELTSYITSILLIFVTQLFFYSFLIKSGKKGMLIYFVYIAPPTSFLLERMNFDIFVIIFGYFALKKYSENKKILSLIILTILTLIKIYPIILLVGIAIHDFINKKQPPNLKLTILITANILIYLFYFILNLQTGFIANPTGISWTFGIPSDVSNYILLFGNLGYLFYTITVFICILIYFKYLRNDSSKNIFSSEDSLLELSFLLCFLFIILYYNFDFRISVFSIGFILLIKNYNLRNFEIISLLFLSTSVSNFYTDDLMNIDPINYFFSSVILIINQITFNLVVIFLTIEIFYFLKNKELFYFLTDFMKSLKSRI